MELKNLATTADLIASTLAELDSATRDDLLMKYSRVQLIDIIAVLKSDVIAAHRRIAMQQELINKYRWHMTEKELPEDYNAPYIFETADGQVFRGYFRVVGNYDLFETCVYSLKDEYTILSFEIHNVKRWMEVEP